MKNLQKGGGELIWIVIVLVFMIGYGYISFKDVKVPPGDGDTISSTSTPNTSTSKITWTDSEIKIDGKSVLSINDFPDTIKISATSAFGESDIVKQAVLSPDGKWLAIAVGGAAHDFGWVYEIAKEKLTPVVFSYGGGVAVKGWSDEKILVFSVTSPKPETTNKIIDVTKLPQYPI